MTPIHRLRNLPRALGLLCVLLSACHHHTDSGHEDAKPVAHNWISGSEGGHCSCRPAQPLPKCSSTTKLSTMTDLMSTGSGLDGHTVHVAGTVRAAGDYTCTKMNCPHRHCNTCWARLALHGSGSEHVYLNAECKGNDICVCCPVDLGRKVVATGILSQKAGAMLTHTTFCQP